MRIFGFSLLTLLVIFAAFVIGGKNPGLVAKIPVIGG